MKTMLRFAALLLVFELLLVLGFAAVDALAQAPSGLPALPFAAVQVVYLGPPPPEAPQIEAAVKAIVTGGYLTPLASEGYVASYYAGAVSWPAPPAVSSAGGIGDETGRLANLADTAGPALANSTATWGQTVYLFIPTDGQDYLSGAGDDDCGWHASYSSSGPTGLAIYAVVPRPTGACVDDGTVLASWTADISHELTEAIARPQSSQTMYSYYYQNWPEPADECESNGFVQYGRWFVVTYEVGGVCTSGSYQGLS